MAYLNHRKETPTTSSKYQQLEGEKTMFKGLNFILAHVQSIEQVLPFYTEKLGLEIEAQGPGFVQFKLPKGEGASYALSQEDNVEPKASTELWWYVDDAEATLAELQARGVAIINELKDEPFGRTLAIQDSAGNKLYILQLAR